MTSKHLINSIDDSVRDNILGLVYGNNHIQYIERCNAVLRKDYLTFRDSGKVVLISGGGSGHEPMFSGFVGPGLLTSAIAGDMFCSPPAGKILELIETICSTAKQNGILLILANYTGDRLNFGLSCEKARLKGYNIDIFSFGEDCAFYGEGKRIGRRGLAGVAFVHKIAGALSERGAQLTEIKDALIALNERCATISISLTACEIPGHGSSFTISANEIELGLGVHGEAGVAKIALQSAKQVVQLMLSQLVSDKSPLFKWINGNNTDRTQIAVLINNLGALSQFELNIVNKEVVEQLTAMNVRIMRLYSGTFMTSFAMSGVSISLLVVDSHTLQLLDSPCTSTAWNQSINAPNVVNRDPILLSQTERNHDEVAIENELKFGQQLFIKAVFNSCKALIESESNLNDLDKECGDADCGSTLAHTSKSILNLVEKRKLMASFEQLARVVEQNMGGTSGAIYSLMFTACSQAVNKLQIKINAHSYDYIDFWRDVLKYGIDTISRYSLAQPGDRTMVDALHSAYIALVECDHSLSYPKIARLVEKSAKKGADSTATMRAAVGRASYTNDTKTTKPDPGAVAVSIWMKAIADSF